jgi:hypothetical protein
VNGGRADIGGTFWRVRTGARSDKMDTIPAFARTSFSEKSSLKQSDADQGRFDKK